MVLGTITGKVQTTEFKFFVEGNAKKFQYVVVKDEEGRDVLAQIVEITRTGLKLIADCIVLGYKDKGVLRPLRRPLPQGIEVFEASDEFITSTLKLGKRKDGAYMGTLEGRDNVKVSLDLNKAITRHICVLAKSGYGKSYTVSVLLEEIIERGIPILIIDPHGEYSSLKSPNENKFDLKKLKSHKLEAKGYGDKLIEYSPVVEYNTGAKPLKLSMDEMDANELVHLLPAKLSNNQLAALYSVLGDNGHKVNFDNLIVELENSENSAKWTLISIIDYVKKLGLFSKNAVSMEELIQPGKASVINLRGTGSDLQEVIVYKLLNDLFKARKRGNIPPFFLVLEEAHNYIPERNFGSAKSSAIIRQIFAEGRKFGLGACLISQRPSRVDKSAISQCTTQIILRVTNPNDVKAVVNSVEGITQETEKEIKNIPIGTAMLVGMIDMPLFVNIRPRRTKHGGEAVTMLDSRDGAELLPMVAGSYDNKESDLIPCVMLSYENGSNILLNLNTGGIINEISDVQGMKVNLDLKNLSPSEQRIFDVGFKLKKFKPSQIFSSANVSFSEVKQILDNLVDKGYFLTDGSEYTLTKYFEVLSNVKRYSFVGRVEFAKVKAKEKKKVNVSLDNILENFSRFDKVVNHKMCWVAKWSQEKEH